jgi:hypothetical protein
VHHRQRRIRFVQRGDEAHFAGGPGVDLRDDVRHRLGKAAESHQDDRPQVGVLAVDGVSQMGDARRQSWLALMSIIVTTTWFAASIIARPARWRL